MVSFSKVKTSNWIILQKVEAEPGNAHMKTRL